MDGNEHYYSSNFPHTNPKAKIFLVINFEFFLLLHFQSVLVEIHANEQPLRKSEIVEATIKILAHHFDDQFGGVDGDDAALTQSQAYLVM